MRKIGIMYIIMVCSSFSWLQADISTSVYYPDSSGIDQPIPSFRAYENGYSYKPDVPGPTLVSGNVFVTPLESTTPYSQGLTENVTRQIGTGWWGTGINSLRVPEGTDLSQPISSSSAGVYNASAMPLQIYGPSEVIYRPAVTMTVPTETEAIPLKTPGETDEFYNATTPNPAITPQTLQLVPR